MATLQKFKILATQCATVAGSPSRSPTTSPVFQLRRRKTLRMLFTRSNGGNSNGAGGSNRQLGFREESIEDRRRRNVTDPRPPQKNKNNNLLTSSNKLKDLFVSSPSPPSLGDNGKQREIVRDNVEELMIDRRNGGGIIGSSSPRPLFSTFRYRLHRRSWRPVLVTISE